MIGRRRGTSEAHGAPREEGPGGRPPGSAKVRIKIRAKMQGFGDPEEARRYIAARRLPLCQTVYLYHQASYDDFAQVLYAYLGLGYTLCRADEPGVTVLTK